MEKIMKIRLLSDLHTEFRLPYKTHQMSEYRGEDVLVLAGDIASGSTNVVDVIKHFKALGFPHIVYVPGNHEYYGTSMLDFNQKMQAKCMALENVYFLNRDCVDIAGVQFIGAPLWTNFNNDPLSKYASGRMIADFRLIKGFTTDHCVDLYNEQFAYIKKQYESRDNKKTVIVTHFLPAQQCISARFKDDTSGLNSYFANNLDEYITGLNNTTWMFGHTHDPVDIVVGTTRVVANPHGYYTARDEGHFFEPFKTIEL